MNLQEARHLRDKGKTLIGRKADPLPYEIKDVIVVPLDGTSDFLKEYKNWRGQVSNDVIIRRYPSTAYKVDVVYKVGANLVAEELSSYFHLLA